jgi:hypothetical protein
MRTRAPEHAHSHARAHACAYARRSLPSVLETAFMRTREHAYAMHAMHACMCGAMRLYMNSGIHIHICICICICICIRIQICITSASASVHGTDVRTHRDATILYFDILADMNTDTHSYAHTSASTHASACTRMHPHTPAFAQTCAVCARCAHGVGGLRRTYAQMYPRCANACAPASPRRVCICITPMPMHVDMRMNVQVDERVAEAYGYDTETHMDIDIDMIQKRISIWISIWISISIWI